MWSTRSETEITQRASVQRHGRSYPGLAKSIVKETGERNLCLAGGVALNCVANGVLLREKIFDNIWIQPAAGDAGGALGAALSTLYLHHKKERIIPKAGDSMKGSYLGPSFTDNEIEAELTLCGAIFKKLSESELIDEVAMALANENAVGWMQGRMEFGPRALGGRSIIADPRSPIMQKKLNLKVKYRESFRPFAPSVLRDDLSEWFEHDTDSPYMLIVANVKKDKCIAMTDEDEALFGIDKLNVQRSLIPAITHVDYSARIQTVHKETNPRYYNVISKFKEKTGCPIVVNTSFNVRGEPIICSPTDAFNCFMSTEMDVLAIGNYILYKEKQVKLSKVNYEKQHRLD